MKIVILGCGRVGARLAQLMEEDGHQVNIIDADPEAFDRLPRNFKGQTVLGTGIDVDVLKAAHTEEAEAFAAVTNYDNTNIMACQVAKEIFNVPKVLARIYDPGREMLYHQLGLETVCPTTLVSTAARAILTTTEGEIDPEALIEAAQRGATGAAEQVEAVQVASSASVPASSTAWPSVTTRVAPAPTQPAEVLPAEGAPPAVVPHEAESTSRNGRGFLGRFRHH